MYRSIMQWRNGYPNGVIYYVHAEFEVADNYRLGAYVSNSETNEITVLAQDESHNYGNVAEYRASNQEGYVTEPLKYTRTFTTRQYFGYPSLTETSSYYDVVDGLDFPVFNNIEDYEYYAETGDDSNAINYDDLHSTKCDFYLTNNGERITVKHEWQDPSQQSSKITSVAYMFKELILDTYHNVTVGQEIDLNTTWDAIATPVNKTLELTINAYNNELPLCTLKATIKRKLLGLGTISAVATVSEDNGYHLYCSTDNSFDEIGEDSYEDSDSTDNNNDGSQFGGFSNLCCTYMLSKTALNDLGSFIWNNSIFDNIKNMNNSPLENIISCHYMPYEFSGTQNKIVVGNVETNVTGIKITQNMVKQNYASFEMPKVNTGFLSYEPYTTVTIYLPFVGMVDLKPNDVCGYTVSIDYVFDFVVGSFGVMVYTSKGGGKTLIYSSQGTCSVDIPLTASNKAQVQSAILQSGVNLVGDIGTKNVGGAINDLMNTATIQNHSTTFGSPSSMVGALSPQYCYYVLRTPIVNLPSNFAHTKGYICMMTYTMSELSGFTKLSNDVDLSGFNATEREKEELINILTSGFYL